MFATPILVYIVKGSVNMREIHVSEITQAVADLCIEANKILPNDLCDCISCACENEKDNLAKSILGDLSNNIDAAKELDIPICQDTGMAVIFAEIGQDVHIIGGLFEKAVHDGVSKGYIEGYLRCSVVEDPLRRVNTGDNTPAIIHTRIVEGDKIKLLVAPKGFGSENMSAVRMLTPASGFDEIVACVKEITVKAGSNPCPPMVLGVGIGGDFEYCAILAKKALCRPVSVRNADPYYAEMEQKILEAVNSTGIGPQGFGGNTTVLAVNVEVFPTHIAGLPVAVNVGCHVTRHAEMII